MSTVESILDLLNRWPAWKKITAAPDRVDALEQRVAELENRLQRAPGEACPFCGALAMRLVSEKPDPNLGIAGVTNATYRCEECKKERTVKTTAR
jgi:hypothetical protein